MRWAAPRLWCPFGLEGVPVGLRPQRSSVLHSVAAAAPCARRPRFMGVSLRPWLGSVRQRLLADPGCGGALHLSPSPRLPRAAHSRAARKNRLKAANPPRLVPDTQAVRVGSETEGEERGVRSGPGLVG